MNIFNKIYYLIQKNKDNRKSKKSFKAETNILKKEYHKIKNYTLKNKGFTLIEFIIVMAIVGILILLASPKFMNYIRKAKLTQIKNDIKAMQSVILAKEADYTLKDKERDYLLSEKKEEVLSLESKDLNDTSLVLGEKIDNDKIKLNTKLKGDFYFNKDKQEVYYAENENNKNNISDNNIDNTNNNGESDGKDNNSNEDLNEDIIGDIVNNKKIERQSYGLTFALYEDDMDWGGFANDTIQGFNIENYIRFKDIKDKEIIKIEENLDIIVKINKPKHDGDTSRLTNEAKKENIIKNIDLNETESNLYLLDDNGSYINTNYSKLGKDIKIISSNIKNMEVKDISYDKNTEEGLIHITGLILHEIELSENIQGKDIKIVTTTPKLWNQRLNFNIWRSRGQSPMENEEVEEGLRPNTGLKGEDLIFPIKTGSFINTKVTSNNKDIYNNKVEKIKPIVLEGLPGLTSGETKRSYISFGESDALVNYVDGDNKLIFKAFDKDGNETNNYKLINIAIKNQYKEDKIVYGEVESLQVRDNVGRSAHPSKIVFHTKDKSGNKNTTNLTKDNLTWRFKFTDGKILYTVKSKNSDKFISQVDLYF